VINGRNVPIPAGISAIVFSRDVEGPAKANLKTRIVTLNPDVIDNLTNDQLYFVLLHEAGHLNLQTRNEKLADAYASKIFLESGRSPKQSVFAVSDVLPEETDEQIERKNDQLKRASIYDYKINKNEKALKNLKLMNENLINELEEYESFYGEEESFLGMGKKASARREERHGAKMARKEAKTNLKNSRAEAKIIKAQSKQTRAENGEESTGSKIMDTLSSVGASAAGIIGGLRGGNASAESTADSSGDGSVEEKKILGMSKTTFYIVAGVTAVVVIGVVAWLITRKK